jgi:hypothetical protein
MSTSADRMREYRQRQSAKMVLVHLNRAEKIERMRGGYISGFTLPPTKTLVQWHVDETGCVARSVGAEA